MEQYVCIHGHFYQPPRENPWLEAIEIQDSAHPYHDWNERVTAECYAPNSASRILNGDGRITGILNNYEKISFNFGPTLLSWMEKASPDIYRAVIEADRRSRVLRSGHGNALAQAYNHIIMPLATKRDKVTQVLWGIRDFEHRFGRFPEGMWLPETAVDNETLDILSACGIRFTILAPHQAARTRKIGAGRWRDVTGGRIDPSRPYLCKLPSGRKIFLLFYDGPISRAVAFEDILEKGEDFAHRLLSGFSFLRAWDQLLHIATDGETYGHHRTFGDMALAYALDYIESNGLARLTNYGEYIEKHPPLHEVQIIENTSWSCIHGIERWRGNCGCNSGGYPQWNQAWRASLREALDWLRDSLASVFEDRAKDLLREPWEARNDYIGVMNDRSEESIDEFIARHSAGRIDAGKRSDVLKLMEIQRHAQLMYTSCGWFFDELSGLETVQVLKYAGRAIQLAEEFFGPGLATSFRERLASARSNVDDHENGAVIYGKFVMPSLVDLEKVAVHYAVSSVLEDYPEDAKVYSYLIRREDSHTIESGKAKVTVGRIRVTSSIVRDSKTISLCVLYLGNHSIQSGVRTFLGEEKYDAMKREISGSFSRWQFVDVVRHMDKHFGVHIYSLTELFRDEQRKILTRLISSTIEEYESTYRRIFENNRAHMRFIREMGMPVPRVMQAAAELTLTVDLRRNFERERPDIAGLAGIVNGIREHGITADSPDIEFPVRRGFERFVEQFRRDPLNLGLLADIEKAFVLVLAVPIKLHLWQVQNVYYGMAQEVYAHRLRAAQEGDDAASQWVQIFKRLGDLFLFDTHRLLREHA